jgi:hypothetical protein
MKPIINAGGKVIAFENDISKYRKEIRSRSNGLLGFYNSTTHQTFDRTGRCICVNADVRASLIPPSK